MEKRNFQQLTRFLLLLTLGISLVGCASSSKIKVPAKVPRFVSPVAFEQATPLDISIALINPSYAQSAVGFFSGHGGEDDWSRLFRSSLANDLDQLVVGKGFKLVGPFTSTEEMTYPQKKQCDLALQTIIDFSFMAPQMQLKEGTNWGSLLTGGSGTKYDSLWSGPCQIQGFVSFEMWETITNQKMWQKKVDIGPLRVDCTAKGTANFSRVYNNAYAMLLEEIYKQAIQKADSYFNREEIQLVTKQSKELRAQKVY